jgi:maltose-binding protein MalE
MTGRLSMLGVAALAALAIAGCGSSSSSSSSSAPSTSTAASSSTTASSSGGGSVASNPAVQQAVAQCKASINAVPTLTADVKAKLTKLCDSAATGDPTAIKKASAQVCQEIAKSLPAQAQQAALASCPKS